MTLHLENPAAASAAQITTAPAATRRRPSARIGLWLTALPLILVLGWALFPGLFTTADPIAGVGAEKFLAPSAQHWFGTDHLGRDIYARVVHGTSQTLLTAGLAVLIGLVAGTIIGLIAATAGRAADAVTMRLVDVLLAVPGFLISLIVVTAFQPGPISLGVGVGIASIASFARVVRSEVLRVRNLDFVEAAFLSGGTYGSVVLRHILPNATGPVLSLLAVDLGAAILAISGLGFLGFGAPPPTPEWGLLISEGRQYLGSAWWMTSLPGLVIVAAVVLLAGFGRQLLKIFRF
ncbi:dipeptide/oligopeptide ABC transporter inner membrane subunit [Arthrobacter crystallopoietes BAB-32]|uniref:Dipeptide/oligopeptide ABC transporter inner membrane subunit n=1 Tax=Arthrobacter crystallopoietes BAB-32 TaxID=1246476 RepID=N1UWU0_9MICC|nr:ABC transporter permease [Arthrobacter crystallopoietes]EMY34851.1 dipeptide/oligopeptide ABC transporter inner membrane subunit [Arthrobacter crystallopoietes BAB-32]